MTFMKPSLAGREPYTPVPLPAGINLTANEAAYAIPQEIRDACKARFDDLSLNRYPDSSARSLRQAIARKEGLTPENVAVGVGSDSLIDCLSRAVLANDDVIVTLVPAFSMYEEYATLAGGKACSFPLERLPREHDLFIRFTREHHAKLIYLTNPNNPTGTVLTRQEILAIAHDAEALVVVDEAYGDFSSPGLSVVKEAVREENIVVLKTFSKAFAFAGGRLGYALSLPQTISMIEAVKSPYFVNSMTLALGEEIMTRAALYQPLIARIKRTREEFEAFLKDQAISYLPSEANFVYCALSAEMLSRLDHAKIWIRKYERGGWVRITIGTEEEMNKVMEVIAHGD